MVKKFEGNNNYLKVNKKAFDKLASEYNKRSFNNIKHQDRILSRYYSRLKENFRKGDITVLDAGCGVGIDSLILSIKGVNMHGLDFSNRMLAFARKNSPYTKFENINFLNKRSYKYNGILMDAFIHLFPKKDIPKLLKVTKSLLMANGLVWVSTTFSSKKAEGYYVKADYQKKVKRFRKLWTKDELINEFEENGFKLIDFYLNTQKKLEKTWMDFIFQKV